MSHINGTKNEILNKLVSTAQPGSAVNEQQKMAIIVRCTEDLEKAISSLEESMNNNAKSSENLAKKIFWLDIVLTAATVIATIVAIMAIL